MKKASTPSSYIRIILAFNFSAIFLAIIWAILQEESPIEYFEEYEIMTLLSTLQLLILAGLSKRIAYFRQKTNPQYKALNSPVNLWKIMTIGFILLAIDDLFEVHETTDRLIHWIFDIQETPLTDRIDDIIVISYSIIGAYIIYCFWHEFKRYRPAFKFFIIGFILTIIMGIFDLYTNDKTLVQYFIKNLQYQELVHDSLKVVEESLKLMAEGVFIAAFCVCLNLAQQMSQQAKLHPESDNLKNSSQAELLQNK
ncbi:MAG: hypothetical protein WBA13_16780 [Microcoleaceae cyanobacterium]